MREGGTAIGLRVTCGRANDPAVALRLVAGGLRGLGRSIRYAWAVRVGGHVWLDLEEQGAVGWADVESLADCPEIEGGDGGPVTGRFHHDAAQVWELKVEGECGAIGVTAQHPVWSADRRDWVAACELHVGERLEGLLGEAKVAGVRWTGRVEPVFNLEVDADHCYRVGEQGILVHNASTPAGTPPAGKPEATAGCCELGEPTVSAAVQDFSGTMLLSPAVLNEKKALIPLSPKSKAISSDVDGHVYIVGAEIPPNHIGASKHTEVFGEGVVIKITQQLLDRILDIIKTQDPTYEIKAGNSVLRSANANASHAEVQAIVSYLDTHPGQKGKTVKVTVSQAPCDYSCRRGVLQILVDYYQTTLVIYFPDETDTYTPKCPSAAK